MLYLTLRQIEYVVTVARTGSLLAAAAALNVSQPSLSVAISQVEERLGQKLFIRSKGARLKMTAFASLYVNEAETLLATARRLEDPEGIRRAVNGRIVLGCFEDLAPHYLAASLGHLRKSLPGVDVTWRIADFETLAQEMRDGRIDLALTYDLGLDSSFTRLDLTEVAPHAFFAPDHPLAGRPGLTIAEIAAEPLILYEEMLSNRHALQMFRSQGLTPVVAHRVRSLEVMRALAAHGEGVGLSYARPPGELSYDGAVVRAVAILDSVARERIILARFTAAPHEPIISAVERALVAVFQLRSMRAGR